MKTDKWLYFRSVTAVASDDGEVSSENYPSSICIPASSVVNMLPTDDTTLRIGATPSKNQGGDNQYTVNGYHQTDYIDLTLGANNKHKEVMAAINSAATNARTPFIVIADDVTGELSLYMTFYTPYAIALEFATNYTEDSWYDPGGNNYLEPGRGYFIVTYQDLWLKWRYL